MNKYTFEYKLIIIKQTIPYRNRPLLSKRQSASLVSDDSKNETTIAALKEVNNHFIAHENVKRVAPIVWSTLLIFL